MSFSWKTFLILAFPNEFKLDRLFCLEKAFSFWGRHESSSRHIKGVLNLFIHLFLTLLKIEVYITLEFYLGTKKNNMDSTILLLITLIFFAFLFVLN